MSHVLVLVLCELCVEDKNEANPEGPPRIAMLTAGHHGLV